MASMTTFLLVALGLLMVDAMLELAFISSMVAWLHARAGQGFEVLAPSGEVFRIRGKPVNLLVDQGHTSNGAAGTAFIVVGLGGLLALWLRRRDMKHKGHIAGFVKFLYNFWFSFTVISALFSLAAFIAVMVITYTHRGNHIGGDYALSLHYAPYEDLTWTPQEWFAALLFLGVADESTRRDVQTHLNVMYGWEWNLIPMTILGFVVMYLAILERKEFRRREREEFFDDDEKETRLYDKSNDPELSS